MLSGAFSQVFDSPLSLFPQSAFNLSINSTMITVHGRVLDGPNVEYKGGKLARTKFGSWTMQDVEFSTTSTLPPWSYIWLSFRHDHRDTWNEHDQLVSRFSSMLRKRGINAQPPIPEIQVPLAGRPDGEGRIDRAFKKATKHPHKPLLLLIILPKADTAIYNHINYLGDNKTGIHTICMVGYKFAKQTPDDNAQYLANVALKFNLKLRGLNQSLARSRLGSIGEGKAMVLGIDVTHPSPGSPRSSPSVAGSVASVDKWLGQWPCDLRIQEGRSEMVSGLADMFQSCLGLWRSKNKSLPDNILIYRDGVSRGQYHIVLETELPRSVRPVRQCTRSPTPAFGSPACQYLDLPLSSYINHVE